MTPQEIFDTVAEHLAKQGHPALSGYKGSCMYRNKNGESCAVGCLIPDEMYDPKMDEEDISIETLIHHEPEFLFPDYFKDNIGLLSHLQIAHDQWNYMDPDSYESVDKKERVRIRYELLRVRIVNKERICARLSDVADKFGLSKFILYRLFG